MAAKRSRPTLSGLFPLAVFLLLCRCQGVSSKRAFDKRPNIVFVLGDDYGFYDVGYHGSRIRTPNLDRLSAEGVRLENYYVQPICTPTRSQLMSGRYQIHTGLQHGIIWAAQPNALPRDSPTLADKLRETGYSTHAVGKWHLGFYKKEFLPTNRGFDSYYGYLTGSEDYYTHRRCFGHWCGVDLHNNTQPVFTENKTYSAHLFTNTAVNVIRQHAAAASSSPDSDRPLFLYLAYQSVHSPLQVPARYMAPYQDIKDKDRRTYAGMVACMDEGVGNVTAALQDTGLLDNTVFIFSTDNGGQILSGGNNWPLRGWKGSLWEGGMKGVGFVHSKRYLPQGVVSKNFMHVTDWYPTLVQGVAGGSLNGTKPLDGYNQWGSLTGQETKAPRVELLHNIDILHPLKGENQYPGLWDTRVRAALRVGDMKLITGDPGNSSWIPPPEDHDDDYSLGTRVSNQGQNAPKYSPLADHNASSSSFGYPSHQHHHHLEIPEYTPSPDARSSRQNVWLFNVTADPEEMHDLSQSRQDIVKEMLQTLTRFNATAVPPRYPPRDPKCNPAKHGGAWVPWVV